MRLVGELDLYNVGAVREALTPATAHGARGVVVALGQVTFLDSTALGALVEARRRLAVPSRFVLAAPGLEVRRALEVSGLDRHFVVRETVEEAF